MEKQSGDAFTLVAALEKFFQIMKNLRNTKILFSRENLHSYRRGRAFYGNADIPPQVLSQRPLVLDPVNPFNNRLRGKNFDTEFFDILANKADASLLVLQKAKPLENANPELFSSVMQIVVPGPFRPQTAGNSVHLIPRPTTWGTSSTNEK